MNGTNELCSIIYVNYKTKQITVRNYTNDNILRAFGVIEHPSWDDYEWFLSERVISQDRGDVKLFLKQLGIDFYDPLLIIEKTDGRMAEDQQWLIRLEGRFYV